MTIRHRIILLVALMFTVIASIGGYAVYQSRNSASEVKSVTEGVVPSALASADLVSQLKEIQLATLEFVYAPSLKLAMQARDKLILKRTALQDTLNSLSTGATDNVQKGLVEQARDSLGNYFATIDESVKLKLAGRGDLAQANLFGNVVQYQGEVEQIVGTLRIEKNRAKDRAIENLNQNMAGTATTISIVTLLAVALLTAISAFLYRKISGPISRMQLMMSEIAASQDFTRRVPVDRMDEIGHSIVAFNEMLEKIQESSAQLKQKTADIQAMLQNMPQGILTIGQGLRIHPEYSTYLEVILETKKIAGGNLIGLVFSDTNLGADMLSQLDAACHACIGEDVMNFEFNRHLLVGEIEKTMPDGRKKVLDLIWSPITDEFSTVVSLMLCVRDITELRKLAAEASEQKRKLEIIGEILAIPQDKFHEFVVNSMKFINENELLIRNNPESDQDAVAALFRNMHTIKGNARTYGLHHLTNIVHKAEQNYDELRKPHPDIAWDQPTLIGDLTKVRDAVENYAMINEISLGRKGAGRDTSQERFLMVDKELIRESLLRLETVNTSNIHELISVRNDIRSTLRLLGTEPIREMLDGVLKSVPSLARDLGKEVPAVRIEDNGYRIRGQLGGMFKNVFTHLVRNAIDHGIETPEVRALQGKPAAGTIRIEMNVVKNMLHIVLSDDGRGLALKRIRSVAAEKRLIDDESRFSDEEIAALIFKPGFSTAERITLVSGRGVGMDAVQNFVKREGGRIEIRFTDDSAGADYRQFTLAVVLPESCAVCADDDVPVAHAETVGE